MVLGHFAARRQPDRVRPTSLHAFGAAAAALDEGLSGVMVSLAFPNVNYIALEEVAGHEMRHWMVTPSNRARLGICLGIRAAQMGRPGTLYTRGFSRSPF